MQKAQSDPSAARASLKKQMTMMSGKSDSSNGLLPLDGLRFNDNSNSVTTETDLGSVKKTLKPEKSLVVPDMIEERSE